MSACKVIALCNQKGGVGKTTTTASLGVGLALEGKRVLLIDADPQASLTVALGYSNPDELNVTINDLMKKVISEKEIQPDEGILHHSEGIDLIPSDIGLAGMELTLLSVLNKERVLKEYVNLVRPNYDFILIDCMPSLGQMTLNSMVAADSIIIPLQPAFLSVKGMNMLIDTIAKVRRQVNPKLDIDGLLFTMVDGRTLEAKEIISSLRNHYGDRVKILDTEIPFSVRAAETAAKGTSIFQHDKNGKVAAAYAALTKEVLDIGKRERLRANRSR